MWAMLCWENDGLLGEQEQQSHVRVAAEMEVPGWVYFDCDASHKLCLPHPSANSCSDTFKQWPCSKYRPLHVQGCSKAEDCNI